MEKASLGKNALSYFEQSEHGPSWASLTRIAEALGVTLAEFFRGPDAIARPSGDGTYLEVPVLSETVAAGHGLDLSRATYTEPHHMRADWVRAHIRGRPLRVRVSPSHAAGQSMTNTILPGAMLTVDLRTFQIADIVPRDVYVLLDDEGLAVVKRLYPMAADRAILCLSDNLAFAPFTIHPGRPGSAARVLGKVVRWEQGENS